MNTYRKQFITILYCLIISLFFIYPYLLKDVLNLEHDTLFHLSRIEGLAQSIMDGNLLLDIYPYKNGGFGYGSALFYSDYLLIPSALLYIAGVKISLCYKFTILLYSFISAFTMAKCTEALTTHKYAPYLASFGYLFSTYRITDVYVRGSLGEIMAFSFLPLVIWGTAELLKENYKKSKLLICLSFSGLILTHNITFFLACILFGSLLLINFKSIIHDKLKVKVILSSVLFVTGATAFFTFGMIEQMVDHTMIVHYYSGSSDLAASALCAWQFFINQTVFGYAGNSGDPSGIMVTNPGWFLTFAPLFSILVIKNKKTLEEQFIRQCMILGYVFMFLCSGAIPWKYLSILSFIQFPWRFMTIATVLLAIPASVSLFDFFKNKETVFVSAMIFCIVNSLWLITPVFSRTFVIKDDAEYDEILNGSIVDPYYSATYMRVELAGGDYLPWPSVDYRGYIYAVRTPDNEIITTTLNQNDTELSFEISQPFDTLLAPLTWFKGYQAYWQNEENTWIKLDTSMNEETGLVQFISANKTGNFKICYEKTTVQRIGILTSCTTLLLSLFLKLMKLLKLKSSA